MSIKWSGLLVIRNKKVLMVKEKDTPFLKFPGGGAEIDENPEQTLKRELFEEIGVFPINYHKFLEVDLPGKSEGITIHFMVYMGEIEGKISLTKDVDRVEWVDSQYHKLGMEIGHLASKAVLPKLLSDGLIN